MPIPIDQHLEQYCKDWSSKSSEHLQEVHRNTHLQTRAPGMISGTLQGRFLSMLVSITRAKRILEIGTFTAYGTLCLAENMEQEGRIYTIESAPELAYKAQKNIDSSVHASKINLLVGSAIDLLVDVPGPLDLIFIDANKQEYQSYFELVLDKCRSGTLIVADNVLWNSQVIDDKKDKITEAIHQFNKAILEHPKVRNLILPFRDGLNLIEVL